MITTTRDLRRRLKKSIRKRTELNNRFLEYQKENQQLKEQLEECQLQNFNLKEDIVIKKMSFPNKEIKDKSLLELYNMPSYEDLKKENQQLKEQLQQKENIIDEAKKYCKHGIKEYITDDGFVEEVLRDVRKILNKKGNRE